MKKSVILKTIKETVDKFEKKEGCDVSLLLFLDSNGVYSRVLKENGEYSKDKKGEIEFSLRQILGINYSLAKLSNYDLDEILFQKIHKLKDDESIDNPVCIFSKQCIDAEKFYVQGMVDGEKKIKVINIDKIL
jgi:hypothetical protein